MKRVRMAAVAAGLLALAAAAGACGGDGDDNGDEGDPTQPAATSTRAVAATATAADTSTAEADATEPPAPTNEPPPTDTPAAPTAAATAPPSVDTLTVSAADFVFVPNSISVSAGNDTAITLTNNGAAPHSMKVYRDQAFSDAVPDAETQTISAGASDAFTLTSTNIGGATQLFFRCEVHPGQMQGTIAVQ